MIQVWLVNCLVVAVVVIIHYECLYGLTRLIPRLKLQKRYRIVVGVLGALVAHAIEIWIFALGFFLMHRADDWGELSGNFNDSILDCAYFSFTVFSTVGFGDIVPLGKMRYLVGIESLTGLVLITWSASFLFFEMQRYWGKK